MALYEGACTEILVISGFSFIPHFKASSLQNSSLWRLEFCCIWKEWKIIMYQIMKDWSLESWSPKMYVVFILSLRRKHFILFWVWCKQLSEILVGRNSKGGSQHEMLLMKPALTSISEAGEQNCALPAQSHWPPNPWEIKMSAGEGRLSIAWTS